MHAQLCPPRLALPGGGGDGASLTVVGHTVYGTGLAAFGTHDRSPALLLCLDGQRVPSTTPPATCPPPRVHLVPTPRSSLPPTCSPSCCAPTRSGSGCCTWRWRRRRRGRWGGCRACRPRRRRWASSGGAGKRWVTVARGAASGQLGHRMSIRMCMALFSSWSVLCVLCGHACPAGGRTEAAGGAGGGVGVPARHAANRGTHG